MSSDAIAVGLDGATAVARALIGDPDITYRIPPVGEPVALTQHCRQAVHAFVHGSRATFMYRPVDVAVAVANATECGTHHHEVAAQVIVDWWAPDLHRLECAKHSTNWREPAPDVDPEILPFETSRGTGHLTRDLATADDRLSTDLTQKVQALCGATLLWGAVYAQESWPAMVRRGEVCGRCRRKAPEME